MTEISFLDLIHYVWKRVWIIIISSLICAFTAFFCSKLLLIPEYTASARVYVLSRSSEDELAYSDLQSSEKLTSDFEVLVSGRNITSAVIERLSLNMTDAELADKISVSSPNSTRILQISVTDSDPALAKEIANCILEVSVEQIVPIMGIDALNVVYEAVEPTDPSAPNTTKNTLLAATLGALAAMAVIVLLFASEDTIKSEDDVMKYLGLSTMGVIPRDNEITRTNLHRNRKAGRNR